MSHFFLSSCVILLTITLLPSFSQSKITVDKNLNIFTYPDIIDELSHTVYVGQWTRVYSAIDESDDLPQLETGALRLKFDPNITRKSLDINLTIFDGDYYDNNVYKWHFLNETLNVSSHVLMTPDTYETQKNMIHEQLGFFYKIEVGVDFTDLIDYKDLNDRSMTLEIRIFNGIDFVLGLTAVLQTDTSRAFISYFYIFICTALVIIKLYCFTKLGEMCENSPIRAKKLSTNALGMVTLIDLGIVWNYIFPDNCLPSHIPSLFQLWIGLIGSVLPFWDLLFMLRISEIRNPHQRDENGDLVNRDENNDLRGCGLIWMIVKSFVVFMIFYHLTQRTEYSHFLFYFLCLFLLPQIWENIYHGGLVPFDRNDLVIGHSSFSVLLLFFRGPSNNICLLTPSISFCAWYVIVVGLQVYALHLQKKVGARVLIPKCLIKYLPVTESYLCDINDEETVISENEEVCSVCLSSLSQDSSTMNETKEEVRFIVDRLHPRAGQFIKTPCGHRYHVSCLVEWVTKKPECPICRAKLKDLF